MGRWVDRYENGQESAVWSEMVGLGPALRQDSDGWAEAGRVATSTMQRARDNVELLVNVLPTLGYRFEPGEGLPTFEPPAGDVVSELDDLEAEIGALPLALRAWFEQVGQVNLLADPEGWPMPVLDPLVIQAPVDYVRSEFQSWQEDRNTEWDDHRPFRIDLGPDALHKANISGGPPYAVEVPNPGVDGLVLWEFHQTTFNNYVRRAFTWAGFAGLDVRGLREKVEPELLAAIRTCAAGLRPI